MAALPAVVPAPQTTLNTEDTVIDAFGYRLNPIDTLNWIDATDGTDIGIRNYGYNQKVGPIALPFTFRFYENNYDNLYIAGEGFLTFDPSAAVPVQGQVPQVNAPNNLIAPYWAPFYMSGKGKKGKIFYSSGGIAPDRYFVVQWNAVAGGPATDLTGGDDLYTFEVILHENGNINFQYQKMKFVDRYYCGMAGIESSDGLIGINSQPYCKSIKSNRSVSIYRPPATARIRVLPRETGAFGVPGTTADSYATVRNVGDLGADTITADLSFSENWDASLYAADGITPLTQIGPLEEGESQDVIIRVQVPNDAVAGSSGFATLHLASTINTNVRAEQNIYTSVTSDFAAVYHTYDDRAMSLDLVRDNTQTIIKVTPNNYNGTYPGVIHKANDNYVYAWLKSRCVTTNCSKVAQELEYTVLDQTGGVVEPIRKLRPLGNPGKSTYQYSYSMASASDGYTAFAWVQEQDKPDSTWNQNIVFATADPGGSHTFSARTLTKHNQFGNDTTENVPFVYNARVVARPDNTFVVIWQQMILSNGKWNSDIYYEILDHSSTVIKKATRFTKAKPGDGYYVPGAIALPDGKVFIAFTRATGNKQDLYAGVLDSSGAIFLAPKLLSGDGINDWAYTTVARISDGNILLTWTAFTNGNPFIRAMTLDSNFNAVAGPYPLQDNSLFGVYASSITADDSGNGIVTFHEYNSSYRHNLYHAFIHATELSNTPVIPFQQSDTYITSSFGGQGNAR